MEIMQSTKGKVLLIAVLVLFLVLGLATYLQKQGGKLKGPVKNTETKINTESLGRPGVQFDVYPADFPRDLMINPGQFDQSSRYKNPDGQEVIFIAYSYGEAKASADMFKTLLTQAKWNIEKNMVEKNETYKVTKENMRAEITFEPVSETACKVYITYFVPKKGN
jgi:hypothetical protein